MPDRHVIGDTLRLTNTFELDGTETDPTTVSLAVTTPSAVATTYTYAAGTVTRSGVGIYYKEIAAAEDGTYQYTWTGTGPAADVVAGSFTVYPAATTATNILTLIELKNALNLQQVNTRENDILERFNETVTAMLDGPYACGPVVQRTVTSEQHRGGCLTIRLRRWPVASVTTLTEYDGVTATVLAVETPGVVADDSYRLDPRTSGTGLYTGKVERRQSGVCWSFAPDFVVATYVAGRYAPTDVIASHFKEAAAQTAKNLWRSYEVSVGAVGEFELPAVTFPSKYGIPPAAVDLLASAGDWIGGPGLV